MQSNKLSRREFLTTSSLGIAGLLTSNMTASELNEGENKKEMLVYIGTYTINSKSEGIYIYKLNLLNGQLTPYKIISDVINPSFLTIDKKHHFLYAVNEIEDYEGKKSGAVSAFAIDQKTGDLQFLNKQATLGGSPCYISLTDNRKFVSVANYSGGNVSTFPVESDGKLLSANDLIQHTGSGPSRSRQEAAHAHSIIFDHKDNFAVICDLGIDKIMIYAFDDKTGKMQTNPAQPFFQTKPGAGPRHFTFHPNHKLAFVVNELNSTVTSFNYNGKEGTLNEVQTVSTLPVTRTRANTCADIHISPNGKFLYVSNRGHDSIVSYQIDEDTGNISYLEHTPTQGKTPRNFVIDPTGKFLLAANQNSNNIVVFNIDETTGKLTPNGFVANVPAPVCLKLIPSF